MKKIFNSVLIILSIILAGNTFVCCKKSQAVIDFTQMDYDTVSQELFNMLIESKNYIGKDVIFSGQYLETKEEGISQTFHSVLMYDQDSCCQVGIQFVLPEGKSYPQEKESVIIRGKLKKTEVNGMEYYFADCQDFESK